MYINALVVQCCKFDIGHVSVNFEFYILYMKLSIKSSQVIQSKFNAKKTVLQYTNIY